MARTILGGRGSVVALLWISAALTALYWVIFFTSGAVRSSEAECYLVFERAFPAADAWLSLACAAAALGWARGRVWAVPCGISAGSAMIYLGLMDVLYNLENGMYASLYGPMIGELVINLFCLSFGPFLIVYFWWMRDVFPGRT